jgi:hypothetical protein
MSTPGADRRTTRADELCRNCLVLRALDIAAGRWKAVIEGGAVVHSLTEAVFREHA